MAPLHVLFPLVPQNFYKGITCVTMVCTNVSATNLNVMNLIDSAAAYNMERAKFILMLRWKFSMQWLDVGTTSLTLSNR